MSKTRPSNSFSIVSGMVTMVQYFIWLYYVDSVWYNIGNMKNCKRAYYDRWHSEWLCSRYDKPCRVCCPCGEAVRGRIEDSKWELFDSGFSVIDDNEK